MVEKSVVYTHTRTYIYFFVSSDKWFQLKMVKLKSGILNILANINRRENFHRVDRERGWFFPRRFIFSPFSLSLSFSFHPLASIDPRPLFYLSNSRLILEIISYFTIKSATPGPPMARVPFHRPPTQFPVECFEIKLIAVIKLLETYRSGGGGAR